MGDCKKHAVVGAVSSVTVPPLEQSHCPGSDAIGRFNSYCVACQRSPAIQSEGGFYIEIIEVLHEVVTPRPVMSHHHVSFPGTST